MKKGAYDYLPKPFTPDEFRAMVTRGLERRRLLVEADELRIEREKNLLEIMKERSRTATIIQCMGEGLLVTNRARQVVLLNPMAKEMLRIRDGQIVGKLFAGRLNNKKLEEFIANSLKNGEDSSVFIRQEIPCEEDIERCFLANLSPILDENNQRAGVVTVLSDISDEKRIDRMKSNFVRLVAHELKAPIGAIEGYLNLILDGMVGDDEQRKHEIIERSRDRANALLHLIRDLLDLSAIEAGKVAQHLEPVYLDEIVIDVVELMMSEAQQKNIKMSFTSDDDLPLVIGDKEDLRRLATNLISNAIKYNVVDGKIDVAAKKNGSYIKLEVHDTGIGISQSEKDKIFDEFYRVKNDKTRKITGTGLGLSIVQKITKSHQGYVELQSEYGKGSTFTVYLPIRGENKARA